MWFLVEKRPISLRYDYLFNFCYYKVKNFNLYAEYLLVSKVYFKLLNINKLSKQDVKKKFKAVSLFFL